MQLQINTDSSLKVHDSESEQLRRIIDGALGRFEDRITRVELYLSDENALRGGQDDKRCLLEARLEGHDPIAASHLGATVILAVEGAADKMARAIESDIGRRRDLERKPRESR
ncbi:MAG: HPF/RaiA family ribosome-associated protein [Gammaproteobacteria bacterium]|nr:HPF/RaiA family ribosome-associated protein [Gammaproteobacteria bacterium]